MIAMMLALALTQDSAREDALRKLSSLKLTVDFDQIRLSDALDFLRDASGLNIVVMPSAVAKDADTLVRLKAKELPLKSILQLLLANRGLALTWRDGTLAVVPGDELQEAVTLKIYDVRSRLLKLQDHPGPRMELVSPTSSQASPNVGVSLFETEAKPIMDGDFMVDLIRSNTCGRSWDSNGKASITLVNGQLVVNQTASGHREIAALLRKLGQY